MADADEHVLEPMPLGVGVVDLVRDRRRQAELAGERRQLGDEPVVVGLEVVAQLDSEVAVGEVLGPAPRRLESRAASPASRSRGTSPLRQPEAEEVAARLIEGGLDQPALEDRDCFSPARWPRLTSRERAV